MAQSRQSSVKDKIADVTECSICVEIFKHPKILPCVHTFCLHCLEKYGYGKNPGNQMVCPICRNEFIIPDGGLCNLPNNFLIGKMVDIGKLAMTPINEAICNICPEGEEAIAKMICVDCEEILCERCSKSHKKAKITQNHHVVELGSKLNAQELNLRNSYCKDHPREFIKMYCYNDNEAICLICSAESHDSHKRVNIDKAAGEFEQRLKDDLGKVTKRIPDYEEAWQKLEKYKEEFAEQISKTEDSIRERGNKLKELIDQHTDILIQNLKSAKEQNLKYIEVTKENVERFRVMIESFLRYCEELLSRGSPVDICRAADQMHSRANELKKLPVTCSYDYLLHKTVEFHPSSFETLLKQCRSENAVGNISIDESLFALTGDPDMDVPINWETMKNDEELKRVTLDPNDQAYKNVAKAVLSTAQTSVSQIVKIERIQNKMLFKQYVSCKAIMDAKNPGAQNEMTLWHGTSADTLESINRSGFNRSYCGKNAVVYGRGVYFAKNFNYFAQNTYSPPDATGLKHVYQCKVLTGEYTLGNQDMTMPPLKPGNTTKKYDSTVDNATAPTIFAIFYDTQAFPEYLVYFK